MNTVPEYAKHCIEYTQVPFTTSEGKSRYIRLYKYQSQDFPYLNLSVESEIEVLDISNLTWGKEKNKEEYSFAAKHPSCRIIYNDDVKIGGFNIVAGTFIAHYEEYNNPWKYTGDYTRKYTPPTYYPNEDVKYEWIEYAEGTPVYEVNKQLFMHTKRISDKLSMPQWWETNDTLIKESEDKVYTLPVCILDACIEKVVSYKPDTRNECNLSLHLYGDDNERIYNKKNSSSYRGKYQFPKELSIDIRSFLINADDKKKEGKQWLCEEMLEKAMELKDIKVKAYIMCSSVKKSYNDFVLNYKIEIPQISVNNICLSGMGEVRVKKINASS